MARSTEIVGLFLSIAAVAVSGCAHVVSGRRFENRPPIWTVDDRRPIPRPKARPTMENATGLRDVPTPLLNALWVPRPRPRARGVNSLDEVPDSTWFENRIGVRDLTGAEIAHGPGDALGPAPPFVVLGTKRGGRALGLLVEDSRGTRYVLKFDGAQSVEVETGNEIVSERLLWASGYHVPEVSLVFFARSDLVLSDEATLTLETLQEVPMREEDLEQFLARAAPPIDGTTLRAVASKILPGDPRGGYVAFGIRRDDLNDRVPHQLRRDVRAQQVFFAWLGHTDVKEGNTLDTWIEEPRGSGRGYLVHHILDFGLSLGAKARYDLRPHDGYAYDFDMKWGLLSIVTLGLARRPWEGLPPSDLPAVGRYEVAHFDPAHFRSTRPYVPFLFTDRFDGYWASKILMRFRRVHVEAAVEQARYGDPRTTRYLVEAILGRQRKTAQYWFGEVNPVDYFRFAGEGAGELLCADDLALRYGLEARGGSATRYRVDTFDYEGRPIGPVRHLVGRSDGLVCVERPTSPGDHDGYVMVRYQTSRDDRELPPVVAHFARNPETGRLWLIGVDRQ